MMEYRPSFRRKLVGWALLVLGALGFVLPFLQGALCIVLGLFVLRHQYLWAHRCMARAQARWPRQVEAVEALELRLIHRVRRWRRQVVALLSRV